MSGFSFPKKIIFVVGIFAFAFVSEVGAINFADVTGFYVDRDFDVQDRSQISAQLVKTTSKLYFYVEKTWWDSQLQTQKDQVLSNLDDLSSEFENRIYPILTSVFGSEWKPGVDGDEKITLLFTDMNNHEGGYFRTNDEYIKLQLTDSNEREMVYLSIDLLSSPMAKVVLAHELVHLITFNQKNKTFNFEEEVWLNEARADYSSNVLGYDGQYEGSNLQSRVKDFVKDPSDSVVEWRGTKYDYASLSLFTNYLVDHFGITVLSDSLKSKYVGIESINYALEKSGYTEKFPEIFTDWTITLVVNDCSLGLKYCYLNKNLSSFKISPALNFLPLSGDVSLSVSSVTKNWAGNWQKFIGGNGDLALDFSSVASLNFKVPYVLEDESGMRSVKFLSLDEEKSGQINLPDFGSKYKSLIIIPSLQTKTTGFTGVEFTYPFTYSVQIKGEVQSDEQTLIQQLLEQIEYLKNQIAELQAKLGKGPANTNYCSQINSNLYFGMSNNSVKCLQEFLKGQGPDIYPEGLVTGYFGSLTTGAVTRFQEKYASEILTPLNLYAGTGFVGPSTRAKINQLLQGL
jgi:hypothetical protein